MEAFKKVRILNGKAYPLFIDKKQEQIKGLKADVLGMLRGRVEDIFIDLQNAMEIKTGDVEPLAALHLEQKEEQLAEIITDILVAHGFPKYPAPRQVRETVTWNELDALEDRCVRDLEE